MSAVAAVKRQPISADSRTVIAGGARAEQARRSLYEFVRQSFHVTEPGVELEHNWHLEAFCLHVQWMLEGWLVAHGKGTPAMRRRVIQAWNLHGLHYAAGQLLVQNMVWNLAPSTLKSRVLMVCAPAWMWLHDPTWSVCGISSNDDNVKRDSNHHRDIVTSAWYRESFVITWRIRRDNDSVGQWKTTAGGERKSRSLLSSFVGVHVDALFLDDPDDPDRVWNENDRKRVQNRWTRTIKNRVKHADKSMRIAIQQRVHVDDWTAAQVGKGQWSPDDRKAWAWTAVPVMFGRGPKEAPRFTPWGWCDPRKVANENMHPARFSESMIADEERDRGPEGFEAQYNQNPDRFDGGMIPRSYVRFFRVEDMPLTTRARPAGCGMKPETNEPEPALVLKRTPTGDLDLDWLTLTIDCSNGSEAATASAVGMLVVGGKGQQRLIFDDTTGIMSIDDMYEAAKTAIATWPIRKVLIEDKAAGPSVIAELKKQLARGELLGPDGLPVVVEIEVVSPGKDSKEGRAAAMKPAWRMSLVYVLDGAAWLYPTVSDGGKVLDQGFVAELCTFPKSKRNDRVDALSQLMTYYREDGSSARDRWKALGSRR